MRALREGLSSLEWRALVAAGGVQSRVGAERAEVALTFDDGPDPAYTPRLLDALSRLEVTATFFAVGEAAARHPSVVRDILSAGHALGSHSYSHPEPWTLGPWALVREYRHGREVLEQVCGRAVPLFRPPKGHLDTAGVTAMRAAGVRPWLWTVDSHDWEPDASSRDIERRVASVGPGDVVLFHDGMRGALDPSALDRSPTLDAIPAVVARLRAADVGFTNLT